MRSILFTLVIMAVLILLIFIPVSAADEEAAKTSTDSISANNTSFTTSSQILPNGVYRIFNWSSLQSLKVEGYGITNNTNVFCEYDLVYDYDDIMEKNALWLLTHLSDDMYTLRPLHKPNFGLDYSTTNVAIYSIGIEYSFSLDSTKWKISAASNGAGFIIQNKGLESRTLALDSNTNNVYTVGEYSGAPYERWGLSKLSDSEVASLKGIIVYGNSAVKIGNSTQLTAGVFSTTTLNQAATYSSNYSTGTVTSNGSVTGVSEGAFTIGVTSSVDSTVTGVANISIVSKNRQTATLIGIPSSSGGTHDHTSYFSSISSSIRSIYGNSSSISTYTSISSGEYAAGYLANSDVTVYRGHGKATYIIFGDSDMYSPMMNQGNLGTGEMRTLSNSDLVLYCCCLCGYGGETGNNLVVSTYNEGAKNVIGFKTTINCSDANDWILDFFVALNQYKTGNKITYDAIINALLEINSDYVDTDLARSNMLYMYHN